MTALADVIRKKIREAGPLGIAEFMGLALGHPVHGYYMRKDPFGAAGDFVTAPEISQIFGEVIGAWVADLWVQMGSPAAFDLLECGPGRGTLMADVMRATAGVKGFLKAANIRLLEQSPALKAIQRECLQALNPQWIAAPEILCDDPDRPIIIIANEFFDALPVSQYVLRGGQFYERLVDMNAKGDLVLSEGREVQDVKADGYKAGEGDIVEQSPLRAAMARDLATLLKSRRGSALIIDYGYQKSAPGDSLQALYRHQSVDILSHIGDADLTAHVDFSALARVFQDCGTTTLGPVSQREFLIRVGALQRGRYLAEKADAKQAADIESGLHRLINPDQMGTLFKVLGVTHDQSLSPAGF